MQTSQIRASRMSAGTLLRFVRGGRAGVHSRETPTVRCIGLRRADTGGDSSPSSFAASCAMSESLSCARALQPLERLTVVHIVDVGREVSL